ncbi:IS630 family transposase [Cohnella algarum]|uniref:IS630 family transposase n=1 Tax=Cohnella algarum TaxID=2044859 RepID=UPI003B82C960
MQPAEQQELEKRLKQEKSRRMYERYQTIYLHAVKQMTVTEIAEIIRRKPVTVNTYILSYQDSGLDGLAMGVSTGAPNQLTAEQQQQLKQIIITKLPHEVGFPAKYNWTLALAVAYVMREFERSYTIAGMAKLLHRLDLRFTKPTYTLEAADEAKQKAFVQEQFPQLKKLMNGEIHHLLFEDESMIRDYQALQQTWFEKGKQRIIPTTGKHRGVKLLATVDYETGEIVWQEDEQYTAETFLAFLKIVLAHYATGKIVIVLDNARIHHAKLLQPFLEEQKGRLEFAFLPPYSPQFNVVEGLWKWLKADVINNVFYHTVAEIRKNVKTFMEEISKDKWAIIDRLCIRMESSLQKLIDV